VNLRGLPCAAAAGRNSRLKARLFPLELCAWKLPAGLFMCL